MTPTLEQILIDWLKKEFDIDTRYTHPYKLLSWRGSIVLRIYDNPLRVECGSWGWLREPDFKCVSPADPDFPESLREFTTFRVEELKHEFNRYHNKV